MSESAVVERGEQIDELALDQIVCGVAQVQQLSDDVESEWRVATLDQSGHERVHGVQRAPLGHVVAVLDELEEVADERAQRERV